MPPLIEQAATELRRAGAVVVPVELPNQGAWAEAERTLLLYEFKAGLERYFSAHRALAAQPGRTDRLQPGAQQAGAGPVRPGTAGGADATAGLADPAYIRARSDARRLAGRKA